MQSFDRLRMKGKRLRMKVLVDEDRLEDQDVIALTGLAAQMRWWI